MKLNMAKVQENKVIVIPPDDTLSIFRTEKLGSGQFGAVFVGKFQDVVEEVAIKRMSKKEKIHIDSNLYLKANSKPNVIKYYGIDYSTDDDFV